MKLDCEPSYILHTRAFRESSLLADILTQNQGIISVIIKGAKRPKSKARGLVNPFAKVLVSAVGRTELLTLTNIEQHSAGAGYVVGKALLSGLYLNELLVKLVHRYDPVPKIFEVYESTLNHLKQADDLNGQLSLRAFEYQLLREIGYGFDFSHDAKNDPIEPTAHYDYDGAHGFFKVNMMDSPLTGRMMLDFVNGDTQKEDLRALKWLMRKAIHTVLNGKTLHSRELARSIGEVS